MKIKPLLPIIATLLASILLISCNDKIITPNPRSSEAEELKQAAMILSRFGTKIENAQIITPEDAKIIEMLDEISLPIPSLIKRNAFLASGINFKTKDSIEISSLSGKQIPPCGKYWKIDQQNKSLSVPGCGGQLIDISEDIGVALNIIKPKKITMFKEGSNQPVQAMAVVSTEVFFEGSFCTYRYVLGQLTKKCYG